MLKNYIKSTFRNLVRNKIYSLINIIGLSIGVTIFIFISIYVADEFDYDKFNKKFDKIYRVIYDPGDGSGQTRTPHPIAQALVKDFPEVEQAVSISPIWGPGLTWARLSVRFGDKKFEENKLFSADSTFFDVFSFKTIAGNPYKAIRQQGSVILTKSTAEKYFGKQNPINEVLLIDERLPLIIKAVIEDIPQNSHFNFDFLISYLTLKPLEDSNYYTWADFGHYNYIVLKPEVDYKSVEAKIPEWSKKYIDYSIPDLSSDVDISKFLKLQPLSDIHLKSNLRWELGMNGNIEYIYVFSISAILILLIACINFTNLSLAKSIQRTKEISIRKVIGAKRRNLILQFLSESILLSIISTTLAVIMVETFIPIFNSFTGKSITINYFQDWKYSAGLVFITVCVGIISGGYPAVLLSSLNTYITIKSKTGKNSMISGIRKTLLVFQFSISVFLISSTLIITGQLDFLKNKKLGFEKAQVIVVPLKDAGAQSKFKVLENILMSNRQIKSLSGVNNIPGGQFDIDPIRWKPNMDPIHPNEMWVDYNFFKTLNIQMVEGRGFSKDYSTDSAGFILNQTAVRGFDWKNPVGEEITWYPNDREIKGRVIGVVKDFHFKSLHLPIEPLIIMLVQNGFSEILIRFESNNTDEVIGFIKKSFNSVLPQNNFEFTFLDEYFDKAYRSEESMNILFETFSVLSILIASLGLLGISTFIIGQKVKEIGIRKVLGASIPSILLMLSKEFIKWIVIANIIAWPMIYYFMSKWLQDFAYHINISWWMFVIAGFIAFIIALLTISFQAIKAATANPVDALKYE